MVSECLKKAKLKKSATQKQVLVKPFYLLIFIKYFHKKPFLSSHFNQSFVCLIVFFRIILKIYVVRSSVKILFSRNLIKLLSIYDISNDWVKHFLVKCKPLDKVTERFLGLNDSTITAFSIQLISQKSSIINM